MWNQTFRRLKPGYLEDCRNLIILFGQKGDFSFAAFRTVWVDMKFTNIHEAKAEDVEDDDFLQELYRIFIDFLFIQNQPSYVRVGAIFGLYALYNSRKKDKIKIKIDDAVMFELQKIQQEFIQSQYIDAFFALREMRVVQRAFAYTALMFSPGPPYTRVDEEISFSVPAEWIATNGIDNTINFWDLQAQSANYQHAKKMCLQQAEQKAKSGQRREEQESASKSYQTLRDIEADRSIVQYVLSEIRAHDNFMIQQSQKGITDQNELFIQRMNLRQIATTLVTRSSNRTQGQDDDDDQNIDDDRRDQIKQSNQIDDGQDIGIDSQGNPIQQIQSKRRKQSTIAAGALGVGSQPRQKVAQQRGRRSQYLMDLTPPSSPSTLMMQQEAEQMSVMAQLQQQQLHLDPSLLQQQDQMQMDPSLLQQQLSEQQMQLQQQQMRMMQGQQDQGEN